MPPQKKNKSSFLSANFMKGLEKKIRLILEQKVGVVVDLFFLLAAGHELQTSSFFKTVYAIANSSDTYVASNLFENAIPKSNC